MNSHKLTITDKILHATLLRLVPKSVTPNMITLFRFVSVPFVGYFLWIENYSVALPLFFISAFSDAIDGSLARTRNLVSNFGKLFDPLADKLLIATAAIILIPVHLGWGIMLAIVSIDLILISSAYIQKRYYGKIIQAENTGKIKMVLQSLGIGALLLYAIWNIALFLFIAQYFFYGAIFFALLSLVVYRAI
ncbi:MAG: CDP-alcohol phosphatidyltransferase family protein [Minisyncoccia bacterium]